VVRLSRAGALLGRCFNSPEIASAAALYGLRTGSGEARSQGQPTKDWPTSSATKAVIEQISDEKRPPPVNTPLMRLVWGGLGKDGFLCRHDVACWRSTVRIADTQWCGLCRGALKILARGIGAPARSLDHISPQLPARDVYRHQYDRSTSEQSPICQTEPHVCGSKLPNQDGRLLVNMFAEVTLAAGRCTRPAKVPPRAAVIRYGRPSGGDPRYGGGHSFANRKMW